MRFTSASFAKYMHVAKLTTFSILQHRVVILDVTSRFYQTRIRFSLLPGSMLHAMFSGRFDTKPSEDGSYFIDRDGTHFRYILNYLRNGQLIVPKEEMGRIREELLAEAEFYQVEGIIKVLKASPYSRIQ